VSGQTTSANSSPWKPRKAHAVGDLAAARPLAMTDGTRDLIDYCEELMGQSGGRAPTKSAFDPIRLARPPYAILHEFDQAGDPVFRLIGEDARQRIGHNPVGTRYGDYIHPERREAALAAFHVCRRFPCAMIVDILQQFDSGRLARCDVMGVPLMRRADDDEAAYMLFLNCRVDQAPVYRSKQDSLRFLSVRRRTFIDLGFGAPDRFEDRVMEEDEPSTDGS